MSLTQPGNPEHIKAAFWIACMEAQIWEMKEQAAKGDYRHFFKEVADCVGVALDCIRLMGGGDSFEVIFSRFAENISKFTEKALDETPRIIEYYLAKIEK